MIEHKTLVNEFPYIEITNAYARAKIALQGAHIFAYQAHNKPKLLWLSSKAMMQEGKAIRGGIPICFPWFGKHKEDASLPQHGFARTSMWKVVKEEEKSDGTSHIRLQLTQTAQTYALWAYDFEVHLDLMVGENLSIMMHIKNTGTKAFEISTALHTYFDISHISNITIERLERCSYYDSLTQSTHTERDRLTINAEIDRVYHTIHDSIKLHDKENETTITSINAQTIVVWNPWQEKSLSMADMSDDGYETMVCIETANALADSRVVEAGKTHSVGVVYS